MKRLPLKPSRWRLVAAILLALGVCLASFGAGRAQSGKPVITTPTPTVQPGGALPPEMVQPWGTPDAYLPYITGVGDGSAGAATAPQNDTAEPPADVNPDSFTYVVQPGDTLFSLAINFGRDLESMSCATRPRGPDAATLFVGRTITVPALSDLCYTVTPGDTVYSIAAHFGLSVETITGVAWNELASLPYYIQPRERLLLPGARQIAGVSVSRREAAVGANDDWAHSPWPQWPYGDGHFVWPVVGPISQYSHAGHHALDIAVPIGTPVVAADRGKVIMAGWSTTGYGWRVVIDHGNDYLTLYAHLSDIFVKEGDIVGKGQVIAASGANGNITGPHLHFEIRDFGVLTDPLKLLPAE